MVAVNTTLESSTTCNLMSSCKLPVLPVTLILVCKKLTNSSKLITYHRELCHYDTLSSFGSAQSITNFKLMFLAF